MNIMKFLKFIFNTFQKLIWIIIRRVILPVSLFLVYILGIGITLVILLIFDRKVLRIGNEKSESFWVKPHDLDKDMEAFMRQS